MTEIIKSFPHLPLWLALSAALPVTWSPLLIYFGITIILALLDWPGLGRAVRSKLLSLREEDYAAAAQMMGAKPGRIIGRHLLPGFMSHLIASATLSIPSMILAETALSFLGLGLRPPITSWGVLLNEATDINVVAVNWWLMLPSPASRFLGLPVHGRWMRDAVIFAQRASAHMAGSAPQERSDEGAEARTLQNKDSCRPERSEDPSPLRRGQRPVVESPWILLLRSDDRGRSRC
jgi:ABC-type dipeptide/oligopeptide/nickel transport system permease subunit